MQRLVFDAKNTKENFKEPLSYLDREEQLVRKYDVSLRFVATMSGLTRWEYINLGNVTNETTSET